MKPEEIERESFRIIREELGEQPFSAAELAVVLRVIHATADFDFCDLLRFSPAAIAEGIQSLRRGCRLVCDVQMIAAGVDRTRLQRFGCRVDCLVDAPDVETTARESDRTRAEVAMRSIGEGLSDAIVVAGNAPTALFEVIRLYETEQIKPALVVGVPVGFVNAAESKEALRRTTLNNITTCGRKGGSTVAVAIVNALLRLAGEG